MSEKRRVIERAIFAAVGPIEINADAAVQSLSAAGYAIVPREATGEMLVAGGDEIFDYESGEDAIEEFLAYAYRAMIAKAEEE